MRDLQWLDHTDIIITTGKVNNSVLIAEINLQCVNTVSVISLNCH